MEELRLLKLKGKLLVTLQRYIHSMEKDYTLLNRALEVLKQRYIESDAFNFFERIRGILQTHDINDIKHKIPNEIYNCNNSAALFDLLKFVDLDNEIYVI